MLCARGGLAAIGARMRLVVVALVLVPNDLNSVLAQVESSPTQPVDVTEPGTQPAFSTEPSPIEQTLRKQVSANPQDASAWRMLGKARLQRHDWDGALEALRQAVQLDDRRAAAYLDLGRVLAHFDQTDWAAAAQRRVLELAPETDYAAEAQAELDRLTGQSGIQLASYDIRSFDGSQLLPQVVGPETTLWQQVQDDFRVRVDVGTQYNGNVQLAPSSRELQNGQSATAQGNAALLIQWYAWNRDGFRAGPTFDSDFTLNEGGLDRFNLQSWRPGAFVDGTWDLAGIQLRPRVAYTFAHDEFGGSTFGNRHTFSTSLASVWAPGQTSTLYYALDHNNIASDGTTPSLTSQDGWSNTLGLLHDSVWRDSWFRLLRFGGDYTHADTRGGNFRFQGVSLFTQGIIELRPQLQLTLKGGWAYRDYFDFTGSPSRNTHIWRSSAELRQFFEQGWSAALFVGFDRFVSDNARYDSERFQTGGVVTWEF